MTDGLVDAHQAERTAWDVIVVGAGMGGGMLGRRLAESGRRVLFVEKGRSTLPGARGIIRGAVPEQAEPQAYRSEQGFYDALSRAGRTTDEIEDISGKSAKRFVPFIGAGTGGSSALYGMVCERFFPQDFTPRQNFTDPGESSLPDAWPVTYEQLRPWYGEAEKLLGVRGQPDPLRPDAGIELPAAPPFSVANQPLVNYLSGRGLHPYHLPMACDYTDDCDTCQTFLCAKSCKNDGGRNGVLSAITEHGAGLLEQCRVLYLDADRANVQRVICEQYGTRLALTAKVVVLAAGALATPVVLLNSRSGDWPGGLANGSDMVGRNLMRHLLEPMAIWPNAATTIPTANKEIGLNDFYFWEGQKYGTLQSFGALPPVEWVTNRPGGQGKALRLMGPAIRQAYRRFLDGGLILAAIMEDLPYLDNRILPAERSGTDGRQRMRMYYRLRANELERRATLLRQLKDVFQPFRKLSLGSGRDNTNLGHVCGTCRFGGDPKTSVLDQNNRAHEVNNLYVADSSFFPSSAGLNPSLTVAAFGLRIAEHINQAHFAQ